VDNSNELKSILKELSIPYSNPSFSENNIMKLDENNVNANFSDVFPRVVSNTLSVFSEEFNSHNTTNEAINNINNFYISNPPKILQRVQDDISDDEDGYGDI
jgi:hypothetical protein